MPPRRELLPSPLPPPSTCSLRVVLILDASPEKDGRSPLRVAKSLPSSYAGWGLTLNPATATAHETGAILNVRTCSVPFVVGPPGPEAAGQRSFRRSCGK